MNTRKFIELRKSYSYPTYQFFAIMSNKNTNLKDGLKMAALTVLSWLRERIGEECPDDLIMPESSEYKKVKDVSFKNYHIDDGYKIDIISNIEKGLWSLKIVEPDLGALGDGENEIPPVAGRLIRSDIGFRIINNQLECGFKASISDLQGTPKANCIRFAVIKKLYNNPAFGLKHIEEITNPLLLIGDNNAISEVNKLIKDETNQLPISIFVTKNSMLKRIEGKNSNLLLNTNFINFQSLKTDKLSHFDSKFSAALEEKQNSNEIINADVRVNRLLRTAEGLYGYCHSKFLTFDNYELLKRRLGLKSINEESLVFIEPKCFGNRITVYPYNDDSKQQVKECIRNYTREKQYYFHNVLFYEDAYIENLSSEQENYIKVQKENDELKLQNEILNQRLQNEKNKKLYSPKEQIEKLNNQLEECNEMIIAKTKEFNNVLEELNQCKDILFETKLINDYYSRRLDRPKSHKEIIEWSNTYFSNQIEFNVKAVKLLEDNSAQTVSIDTICDALDYLGTLYYQYRFENMSLDKANYYSSKIYNRYFDISPSGIKATDSSECKIKYSFEGEKRHEVILDFHLKIGGSRDKDLLRIYFIHDERLKKIVIGALPNHLSY